MLREVENLDRTYNTKYTKMKLDKKKYKFN